MKSTASISIDTAVFKAMQAWAEAEKQPVSALVERIVKKAVSRSARRRAASAAPDAALSEPKGGAR